MPLLGREETWVHQGIRLALRVIAAGLVATAVTAAIATTPAQAQTAASGGGCNTEVKNGFRIGACISVQNNTFYPDAYITWNPAGCYWISIDMRDSHLNLWERKQFDTCTTGHYVGTPTYIYPRLIGHYPPYFTEVTVVANGVVSVVDSPYQYP